MSPHFIALKDCPVKVWRNGGGQTRELLAWPAPEDWRLRISVADVVQDGPFSLYPGVQRHLAVWQGTGLALHREGVTLPLALTPAAPAWSFDGEWLVAATLLHGPVRDLNLMCRGLRGGLFPAVASHAFVPTHRAVGLFATQRGVLSARSRAGESAAQSWTVPAQTLCWFDAVPGELWWTPERGSDTSNPSAWWIGADVKEAEA